MICPNCSAESVGLYCSSCGERHGSPRRRQDEGPRSTAGTGYDKDGYWSELSVDLHTLLTLDNMWVLHGDEQLMWWPSAIPVEVSLRRDTNATPRHVRVRSTLCRLPEDVDRESLLAGLYRWNVGRPGAVAVYHEDTRIVTLEFSAPTPAAVRLHVVRFVADAMVRQAGYGIALALHFVEHAGAELVAVPHPTSGTRQDLDELVGTYAIGSDTVIAAGRGDLIGFLDPDVSKAYRDEMASTYGLREGWSNVEAVYFDNPDEEWNTVGLGIMTDAESSHGAHVRMITTLPFRFGADVAENVLLAAVNDANRVAARIASDGHSGLFGHAQLTNDQEPYLNFELIVPAYALADFNDERFSPEDRARLLGFYAVAGLQDAASFVHLTQPRA